MKKTKIIAFIFLTCFLFLTCNACAKKEDQKNDKEMIVLAYVTSWSTIMPDPTYLTHINYAFGHVTETFDGIRIDNEDRLKSIVNLKKEHPHLKIFISIGGWGSGRFSEMAADDSYRQSFAKDCKRVLDEFKLDGIDIDWEYPTADMAGISASPNDTDNFTLMMKDIRNEIGNNKLLTLATAANAKYIDFKGINPYVDFVNIMSYDMGRPPVHHSGLYRSEHTGNISVDEAVMAHVEKGMPLNKLVMGIPFYGRATDKVGNFTNYKNIIKLTEFKEVWDETAQSPYLIDEEGNFVCGFDNPRSVATKCQYIKDKGMLGAMYWDYDGDDENGTLRKAVFNGLNK